MVAIGSDMAAQSARSSTVATGRSHAPSLADARPANLRSSQPS